MKNLFGEIRRWMPMLLCLSLPFIFYCSGPLFPKNYFYPGDWSFKRHVFHQLLPSDRWVALIGNSGVAGSDVPPFTHIADQINLLDQGAYRVMNFGSWGSNLWVSLWTLNQVVERNPEIILLGIAPEDFRLPHRLPYRVLPYFSSHSPSLIFRLRSALLEIEYALRPFIRGVGSVVATSWSLRLQTHFYGELFGSAGPADFDYHANEDFTETVSEVLTEFKKTALSHQSQLVVWIQPVYSPDETYGKVNWLKWKDEVSRISRELNVPLVDLSGLLENNSANFIDHLHLKPRANTIVASRLLKFLSDVKVAP